MKNFLKVALVALALMLTTTASAQLLPISLGLKGGVTQSNVNTKGYKSKTGFNAGLTLDINLPANLAIMSGLEVNTKGAKVKHTDLSFNAMYLQLPVHLGYRVKLLPGISAHFDLGPYFAQGISGKTKVFNGEKTVKVNTFGDDGLKKFDWGLGGGVGVTFLGKIGVRAGYDHGLATVSEFTMIESGNLEGKKHKMHNRSAYLSAHYKFF